MAAELQGQFRKPFAEQQAFFRRKLALPSEHWDDIQRDAHDVGFIVAGATKADLVADLKGSIQEAIDQGRSIQWFRDQFGDIVQRHGWAGWTGSDSPGGVAWRTRTIYTTNMKTSYAAGRWAQMTDPDVLKARPYWVYKHRTVENPRLSHKSWHDLVLPAMHPWFQTHWAPNGFGCNCTIISINGRQLAAMGKTGPDTPPNDGTYDYTVPSTGEVVTLPKGVQYGWDYAPGRRAAETAMAARLNRLDGLDHDIARLNVRELVRSELFGRFFRGDMAGEFPVGVLSAVDQQLLQADTPVVLLSQHTLATHLGSHPEVTLRDYLRIQQILDDGRVFARGEQRLVYLLIGSVTYRAALKRTRDGRKNYFLTLFKNSRGEPPKDAVEIKR